MEKYKSTFLKLYREEKKKHPDCIFLLRCGDYYESVMNDAVIVSKVLGVPLSKIQNCRIQNHQAGIYKINKIKINT